MTACPTTKPFNRNQGREKNTQRFSHGWCTDGHRSFQLVQSSPLDLHFIRAHLCPICGKQVWPLSAPACRQAMIPEHLAWLAKSPVRHGNKIPYVSRVTPFTTIITDI